MTSGLNIPMPREQLERIVRQVVRERLAAAAKAGAFPGGAGMAAAAGAGTVAGAGTATATGAGAGAAAWAAAAAYEPNLVVNVSARHLHITPGDLQRLFGPQAELTVYRWLYQPGEFAAEQTVTILGPRRRMIERVRILGPVREYTQVEVAFTDAVALGIDAPVRPSGQIDGTPGCIVIGPAGVLEMPRGVIRAERHVHMSPADAAWYGLSDRQYVRLRVESGCSMTFDRVLCRVDSRFLLEVHLDTDEGNACDLPNATSVELMA